MKVLRKHLLLVGGRRKDQNNLNPRPCLCPDNHLDKCFLTRAPISLTCSPWPSCSVLNEFCFGNHGDLSPNINTGQSVHHIGTHSSIYPWVCTCWEALLGQRLLKAGDVHSAHFWIFTGSKSIFTGYDVDSLCVWLVGVLITCVLWSGFLVWHIVPVDIPSASLLQNITLQIYMFHIFIDPWETAGKCVSVITGGTGIRWGAVKCRKVKKSNMLNMGTNTGTQWHDEHRKRLEWQHLWITACFMLGFSPVEAIITLWRNKDDVR